MWWLAGAFLLFGGRVIYLPKRRKDRPHINVHEARHEMEAYMRRIDPPNRAATHEDYLVCLGTWAPLSSHYLEWAQTHGLLYSLAQPGTTVLRFESREAAQRALVYLLGGVAFNT